MDNNAVNCWGFWGCDEELKENCYTYKKGLGSFCWVLSNLMSNKDERSPKVRNRLTSCLDCLWYQEVERRGRIKPEDLDWDELKEI